MNYNESLAYINSTTWFGGEPGLGRIRALLSALGDPQKAFRTVHIAGTNGKGSCAAMTASVLKAAGYRTGLFTSPYLHRFNERMQINGREIEDEVLAGHATAVRKAADAMAEHPTAFEMMTACAFLWFAAQHCEIAVLETGLGGRYDATNSIENPEVCVIMNIGLDHTRILGNTIAEGVLLEAERFKSFVGMYPMPTRYALTIGEYARYINKTFNIGCDLIVIPCENYKRDTQFKDTGLCWINPSPNIPTQESALVYIGTCLFEGTNISEGRGTTHPFELVGAPFIDASKLAGSLNAMKLPGIRWRPAHFTPMFSKFANELCHGVQLHITDPIAFRPFEAGLRLFDEIRQNCPELKFYSGHFDHLIGTDTLRLGTESVDHMIERAKNESQAFMEQTRQFRIY